MKSLKLVTLSYLQEESQVYVFHLLVEVGFLPFYEHRFFELHLVLSSCRSSPGSPGSGAVRCALVVLMYFSECVICNKVKFFSDNNRYDRKDLLKVFYFEERTRIALSA